LQQPPKVGMFFRKSQIMRTDNPVEKLLQAGFLHLKTQTIPVRIGY
jgi:hypothetical protein